MRVVSLRTWFQSRRAPAVAEDEPLVVTVRVGKRVKVRDGDALVLDGEDLVDADFSDRKLEGLAVDDCRLTRCRFERMRVKSASFGGGLTTSQYTECSFDGSRFEGTDWGYARFVRCSFRDVRLKGLFGWHAEFVDCVFTGRAERMSFHGRPLTGVADAQALADRLADLLSPAERAEMQARIDDAPPDRPVNEFRGNDFSGMDLVDVAFLRGIDLGEQRFPAGSVILTDPSAAIARARAQVAGWDDDADREFALAILRNLTQALEDGQEQLYMRADDWREGAAHRALFELLAADAA
jgi:uncharacterized protein YjbI with pentapeptide repeats